MLSELVMLSGRFGGVIESGNVYVLQKLGACGLSGAE